LDVKVRFATYSDIDTILKLLYELGRPAPKNNIQEQKFSEIIRSFLSKDTNKILLAIIPDRDLGVDRIIGLLSYILIQRLNLEKLELWIPELVVSHEYRDKGIGTILLNECESVAKNNNCYRIRLESGNDRIEAHNFYKKLGFKQSAFMFEKRLV
jgi:GNAT superfamily N-acetyltransferase